MSTELEKLYEDKDAEEDFRDHLATVDEDGKRIWVYPKKPKGKFTNYRMVVSILLLTILVSGPFIKIGGAPLLLFNVLERKFIIFGQTFWPQDFFLAVIGMITTVVFIILFTVVFGRIFCGWICPQTIFMEWVFRKVEYFIEGDYMAQKKLDKQDWNQEKIFKKSTKHIAFLLISVLIMHTFLAYIIGVEDLQSMILAGPQEAFGGFIAMTVFTGLFYGVFGFMREQVCTTVCPYGRLQGVLLDKQSVVVAYDHVRGENRAKLRKGEDREEKGLGDCIDCKQCVYVCPTGIDIRNGTQLDCVNCTACIDACDSIMDRIKKPKGLVRYASEENILEKTPFKFTTRTKAYSAVLVILIGVLSTLLMLRSDVETTILRTPGIMYQKKEDGRVSNLYQIKMVNKTSNLLNIRFELLSPKGEIQMVGDELTVSGQSLAEGAMFVVIDPKDLQKMSSKIKIGVYSGDALLEEVGTKFLGPSL
ncbi:MAG: cytochrome c oxidase accessory protein FixG [Cyclobacteriaceae bacterium]|jgi:cytochrome c oxidase accessory protein FixG